MTYRVIDKIAGEDITDKYDWALSPDGELNYLLYCDLIGDKTAEAVFTT